MTKKEFALGQLAPYYKNPSTCGVNEYGTCMYLTKEGKMCVAGKNLLKPIDVAKDIDSLIDEYGQEIFKPEARNILTKEEWRLLQKIHDNIAKNQHELMLVQIESLNLFTFEELVEYSKTL